MSVKLKILLSFVFCLFSYPFGLLPLAFGQDIQQNMYIDDPVYSFLDYQINSGKSDADFVMQQPFDMAVLDTNASDRAGRFL